MCACVRLCVRTCVCVHACAAFQVNDITVDLCDGLLMMQMVQGLLRRAGRSGVGMKYNKNPRLKQHKLENLGIILHALKEQKIKLVNIGKHF